jgi:WD40 repeat protein
MNSPQRALKKRRAAMEDAIATDDERDAVKRETLRALKLKTVIRENHGRAYTTRVEFARGTTRISNLYATCGGKTATVYDDEHFGDHTAIVAQYVHETTEHQVGGEITCVCWARNEGEKENEATTTTRRREGEHEFGDAILTVGDEHGWISVISVAENRVVARLNAHPGSKVRDMDSACARDGFVVSVGDDGFLKAWDIFGGPDGEGECVGTFDVGNAVSVACDANGTFVVIGHADGVARRWNLSGGVSQKSKALPLSTFTPRHPVDCVRIVGDVVFAKTRDGRVETCDLSQNKSIASWTLPNEKYRSSKYAGPACRFGVSGDGKFLACGDGTDSGVVYVYDARTGERIVDLQPLRVVGVVHAAAVVDHCRHVFAAYGPAVVWRYEVIDASTDDASNADGVFEAVVK